VRQPRLKVRETGDCQVAPTGPLRQFPPGVLPTSLLSRLIRYWWRPVALPPTARPITISVANFESPQVAASCLQSQVQIALQLHQNCTRIAPELHQNCTGIAAKPQQLHTIAAKSYRGGGGRPATRGKSARRNCNLVQPPREATRPCGTGELCLLERVLKIDRDAFPHRRTSSGPLRKLNQIEVVIFLFFVISTRRASFQPLSSSVFAANSSWRPRSLATNLCRNTDLRPSRQATPNHTKSHQITPNQSKNHRWACLESTDTWSSIGRSCYERDETTTAS
jgi:hypothetical protein